MVMYILHMVLLSALCEEDEFVFLSCGQTVLLLLVHLKKAIMTTYHFK